MEAKKEGNSNDKYIRKLAVHSKIEEVVAITREFLKETYKIKHEYTFDEFKELFEKKHIPPETRSGIIDICELFSHLEYKQRKPNKREVEKLKKKIRDIIRGVSPKKVEEKKRPIIFKKVKKKAEKIKKNVDKHKEKKEKVEKVKENIAKEIIKRVKEEKPKDEKETKEIVRFIDASLDVGMKLPEIKKELNDMGFHKDNIDYVIEKRKKSY